MSNSGDLLVIVPSRARPQNLARLLNAVHKTRTLETHVYAGVDDDDPALPEYERIFGKLQAPGDRLETGPRKGLAAWTNHIAARMADRYPYLASLGDDHLPRTKGWDQALVRAIKDNGGTGFSYPHDGTREDIPEAVVVSSDIVKALGWMAEPALSHYYIDNVWADLGRQAGCLRYLRAIAVDHLNPATGKIPGDATYAASSEKLSADQEAYFTWRAERMSDDVRTVRELQSA